MPAGFISERDQHGRLLIVREELRDYLAIETVCANTAEVSAYHGRERLRCVWLKDGERALIRSYRHGGMFRAVSGKMFFTRPLRPLRELAITEELRHRGVPTVEPCGACVEPVSWPFYRGWFITRELSGARDLWEAVSGNRLGEFDTAAIFRAAADGVKLLHREGVYHGDLNLKNILVRRENNVVKGYIIDFDKATLFLGRLPDRIARKNLDRLRRSLRKLDPAGRFISEADWQHFLDRYHDSRATGI
jgi:tRNA A-37 threonylcarbamoyl transferase component Bud32